MLGITIRYDRTIEAPRWTDRCIDDTKWFLKLGHRWCDAIGHRHDRPEELWPLATGHDKNTVSALMDGCSNSVAVA